jgi:hypothetical protein
MPANTPDPFSQGWDPNAWLWQQNLAQNPIQGQSGGNDALMSSGIAASQQGGFDLNQIQQQANTLGQNQAFQGPQGGQSHPQSALAGNVMDGANVNTPWGGFTQGQYPWPTPDPTASFPHPQNLFPMGWNSYPVANAQMQMMNSLIPGFTNTIPPGYAGFDPNSRANQFNLMVLGAAANLTLGQALGREGRNDMAQQGLLGAINMTGNNPGVGGSAGLSSGLAQDPFTTSNDALQQEIEGILTRGLANAREGALATAQGALGSAGNRGGESALLQSGLDFGSRAAQADAIGESRVNQAMRRAQDIANAQQQFQGTSNIFNQSVMGPAALGADFLSNRQNVDTNSLIEQMRAMAGLAITENLWKNYDVSTMEAFMPAITGLIGNFLGGMGGGGGG